ncbi:MAG: uroporphyrinogen decarboxylase family protein [Bacteriovoracia bacterium]
MNLFQKTLNSVEHSRPPVWFMRQAGRYHSHYQNLKKQYSFETLCKNPELASEVALGPVNEFDFDAAILFSDILFPLQALGMPLEYNPGPKLGWLLSEPSQLKKLNIGDPAFLEFQKEALILTKKKLSVEKGLIGFVGAPFTLYCYAVEGSHKSNLSASIGGLASGVYDAFLELLLPLLLENMKLQASAGIDTIALFDTCAGSISPMGFREYIVPPLRNLIYSFKNDYPNVPVTYYSKGTSLDHLKSLSDISGVGVLGVDWNLSIVDCLSQFKNFIIQGNVDPHWLLQESYLLERKLHEYFSNICNSQADLSRWICGLGHGILQNTPEANVHLFIKIQREYFKQRKI